MTFYRQASCDKCVHLQKIMLRKDFSCLLLIISHCQAIEELLFFARWFLGMFYVAHYGKFILFAFFAFLSSAFPS